MPEKSEEQLLLFTQAMANLVASDGRITDEERYELENVVSGIGLSPSDPKVVELINAEFQNPGSLTAIVRRIDDKELRAALLRMMVEVACADGEIAKEEREKVDEAAAVFGFDKRISEDLIDWTLDSIRLDEREKALMARLLPA